MYYIRLWHIYSYSQSFFLVTFLVLHLNNGSQRDYPLLIMYITPPTPLPHTLLFTPASLPSPSYYWIVQILSETPTTPPFSFLFFFSFIRIPFFSLLPPFPHHRSPFFSTSNWSRNHHSNGWFSPPSEKKIFTQRNNNNEITSMRNKKSTLEFF